MEKSKTSACREFMSNTRSKVKVPPPASLAYATVSRCHGAWLASTDLDIAGILRLKVDNRLSSAGQLNLVLRSKPSNDCLLSVSVLPACFLDDVVPLIVL